MSESAAKTNAERQQQQRRQQQLQQQRQQQQQQQQPQAANNNNNGGQQQLQLQITKLRDANLKYKNLLKLAKERIQLQENELEECRNETQQLKDTVDRSNKDMQQQQQQQQYQQMMISLDDADHAAGGGGGGENSAVSGGGQIMENSSSIVQVLVRVKVQTDIIINNSRGDKQPQRTETADVTDTAITHTIDDDENDEDDNQQHQQEEESKFKEVIWALIEFEIFVNPDAIIDDKNNNKRYTKWIKFDTESQLEDYIRRDTGEPILLPPYSLTEEQSIQIQKKAQYDVIKITEEFRRFRVKSELAKKQSDNQIRELQNNFIQNTKNKIEYNVEKELEYAQQQHKELERIKIEMAEQEAHWKEAYDVLLAENKALKSSGSEALLASKWRQRYETCLLEKEDLMQRLKNMTEKMNKNSATSNSRSDNDDADSNNDEHDKKYEMKYRDLKESFRLYRKKAKEIFEAQQLQSNSGSSNNINNSGSAMNSPNNHHHAAGSSSYIHNNNTQLLINSIGSYSDENSKISYLKNLMVNYLSSEPSVREHMESAIGTVLQFTPEDIERIEKQNKKHKAEEISSWF